ncbi:uncharacterized protein DNG_06437 [Cephalotrichum gorgonifer]|uniref:N-acetyltransferase domain-containing protein n=1 Tax=Cephalotrichum gorgonifer TaxID=2041049 RepID=A0AAE8N1K7_9PEZI|nr:uncharacterized protein DNG_06437 [Cephalotrichum gorgonifer]
MSALPTAAKATQSSILSFFHQKQPKYAQPPQANGAAPGEQQQQPAGPPPSTMRPSAPPPSTGPPPVADKSSPAPTHPPAPAPAPAAAAAPSPHPQASIRPISPGDITALRRINSLLLPVAYPDAFYQHVLDPSISALFSRAITWSDDGPPSPPKVVGGIVCRLEEISPPGQGHGHVLYIQSLCLLSPYRSLGLAAAALDDVLAGVRRDPSIDVSSVYAHVWTENEDGLAWYRARGFVQSPKPIEDYYFKLRPASAWVVQKVLEHDGEPLRTPPPSGNGDSGTPAPALPQAPSAVPPSATARLANLPPRSGPPRTNSGQSFQNVGPGAEWNDLPADMAPPMRGSGPNSGQSSRSSSSARKKRDRAYPAEAFGN